MLSRRELLASTSKLGMALDKVTVRDAPIRRGGSLVVEAGRRGSNPA